MNASKTLTFAASLLIASAGVAGIRAYANASANSVLPAAVGVQTQPVQTLPEIVVRPTQAELDQAFGHTGGSAGEKGYESASLGGADIDMPYYSFAARPVVGNR
ncbi:MAG TPA: hypothetical protein VJ727_00965 [Rhodanobacteraceae bacterium]|nr:hypothetical protein [Rhodanobacteraceae bacterium]